MSAPVDCVHCGHPPSTHHAGGDAERACAVKGCDCIGYVVKGEAAK